MYASFIKKVSPNISIAPKLGDTVQANETNTPQLTPAQISPQVNPVHHTPNSTSTSRVFSITDIPVAKGCFTPVMYGSHKTDEQFAEPATIIDYMTSIGAKVLSYSNQDDFAPVLHLVDNMARVYADAERFLHTLRVAACSVDHKFTYFVKGTDGECFNKISQMATMMASCGIFTEFFSNSSIGLINGQVSSSPRVINFINGVCLELIIRKRTENLIKHLIDSTPSLISYELKSNVVIEKRGQRNELDMVFRLECSDGRQLYFWCEVKGGRQLVNYDKYREIGLSINLNPERHILIQSTVEDQNAAAISYFQQYYVANYENYDQKLEQMITNALLNKTKEDVK